MKQSKTKTNILATSNECTLSLKLNYSASFYEEINPK